MIKKITPAFDAPFRHGKALVAIALSSLLSLTAAAQAPQEFTAIVSNPITSVKNQNRSGTCWDYATTGFFEAEILRKIGRTYDLSEMYTASKDYMDCAEYHVRMHGYSRFSEGGSADDVLEVMRRWGAVPEEAMAGPGSMVGDTLADFTEFFPLAEAYMKSVATSKAKQLSTQWKAGLQGILDAYLGKCPEEFTYEGKRYTPQTFFNTLGLDLDDYVSLTSFTHHPFRESFVIEAPYKWRPRLSYNIPLDELMDAIDKALERGYVVCWGGDVSGEDFSRRGLAILRDMEKARDLTGTDAARWFRLTVTEKRSRLDSLGVDVPEMEVTQEKRQERFDDWQSTYDHVMLIYGIAKDHNGRPYYMVKNSWGRTGDYDGTWYMSRNYIAMNTTYIFLNREALDRKLADAVR